MSRAEMEEVRLCVLCSEDITANRVKRKLTGSVANIVGVLMELFEEVLPSGCTLDQSKYCTTIMSADPVSEQWKIF